MYAGWLLSLPLQHLSVRLLLLACAVSHLNSNAGGKDEGAVKVLLGGCSILGCLVAHEGHLARLAIPVTT